MRVARRAPGPRASSGPCRPRPRAAGAGRRLTEGSHVARASEERSGATPADPDANRPDLGVGLKAAWFGAELLGNALAAVRRTGGADAAAPSPSSQAGPPALSRADALAAIREDYDSNYFVTGSGAMAAYAPDCLFSDPFVSFRGVQRFKQNVSNLGAMISDVQIDITDWREEGDAVTASWRFSAILDLPWRPRLAAAGSTTHVIDPATGAVVQHIERWKADPGKVVASLLRPAAKVPENRWEAFMAALSDGDPKGMWFNASPAVAAAAAPVAVAGAVCRVATGHGLPGGALGAAEGAAWAALAAAGVTQVVAFATAMYGGEAGSGGRF